MLDLERRETLRSFLMDARARLRTHDVGLPLTARRRVSGLRRGEIAELIEVSVDWYRRFESGRCARVSIAFLSRVARVLRLSVAEQFELYRLAIPEMYEITLGLRAPSTRTTGPFPPPTESLRGEEHFAGG